MIIGRQNIRRYLKLKRLWERAVIRGDITAAHVFQVERELMIG